MLALAGAMPPSRPNPLTPKRWQTISQRGWANGGSRGRSPLAGGMGDVPPKAKGGGELPTLATPPRVGPKTPANPQPTGVGKGGPGGASPLAGGCGGCPPQIQKRERVAHISTPTHEWDPKPRQTLSPRGWAMGGSRGRSPHGGGLWGVSPTKTKEGTSCPH